MVAGGRGGGGGAGEGGGEVMWFGDAGLLGGELSLLLLSLLTQVSREEECVCVCMCVSMCVCVRDNIYARR